MNPDNHEDNLPHDPDEEMREHVYDGIQEYDKKLPNWWLMTFYGTILFSIGYWFYFHITEVGNTPEEKLAQAQARAAAFAAQSAGEGFSAERLVALSEDSAVLDRARRSYASSCAACHGAEFQGGIGPNLKDGEWIHGGAPSDILRSIKEGIPARGMPGWASMLGATGSAELTALLLSLNPALEDNTSANGAAPEAAPTESL